MMETSPAPTLSQSKKRSSLIWDVLLIGILLVGAAFRLTGVNWDENTHMHPDERFLTMVATSLQPVQSLSEYFNTAQSTLNPNNRGYGFYVYGTLPMFIVRYVAEWVHQTGYDEIHLVGRQLSALFDLGTVFLVYLIASRLYRRPRLALMAALFYALAVLPIQLSHYFKEDTFMTFFATLTVFWAVRLLPDGEETEALRAEELERGVDWLRTRWGSAMPYIFFGVALGMTVASKVIVAPIAVLLPFAAWLRYRKLDVAGREKLLPVYLRNLVIAAVTAFLVFRIFQPYAFEGPGFFNIGLNPKWVNTMQEVARQNSGDVDFPPQLQWARRPVWFGFQNIVLWGLGLPLGALAWLGFLAMGWKMLKGDWARHILVWAWTGLYFGWQSSSATPSMRYFMPIYPLLAIFAAWGVFALWDSDRRSSARFRWRQILAGVIGLAVTGMTLAWAYAFVQIYVRPFTRVEASRWIYQNIPGPINLYLETPTGRQTRLLAMPFSYRLPSDRATKLAFIARRNAILTGVEFPHIRNMAGDAAYSGLIVLLSAESTGEYPLAYAAVYGEFKPEDDPRGGASRVTFDQPVMVEAGKQYYLILQPGSYDAQLEFAGAPMLIYQAGEETIRQALPEAVSVLRAGESFVTRFDLTGEATLQRIYLAHVLDWEATPAMKILRASLRRAGDGEILGETRLTGAFLPAQDPRGEGAWLQFNTPVSLAGGQSYELWLEFEAGDGALAIYGSKQALESSWDDALPLSLDGYSPYDYYSGVFRSDLNFEMYWDDNTEKRDRFQTILDQADYIFISSNRQWGTTVRVPERYPLTTLYYRNLLGCPEDREITWCYAVAEPGMFQGKLGFELIKVFDSSPRLGSLKFNTQFAEEAFTVYDHPKVFIFKKTADYRSDAVRDLLASVDLTQVVHLTPAQAGKYPGNLMLPPDRLKIQRAGGTWSELFDRGAWVNRYPGLGVILWYLTVSLLGWVSYPLVRLALRGLPDRGYPLARLGGLLLLAYPVWLAGSAGVPFNRQTIGWVAMGLVVLGGVFAWIQREELREEWRTRWRYFLAVEAIALAFFVLFLLVRLGNPDLWHQWKGGEKPMDFSYFNAVLKSTIFPPYDPWFAGGYINYYYYGFVLVGVPVKWLGIIPAVAYNIILPQWYSLLALGAFSIVWNILVAVRREAEPDRANHPYRGALLGPIFLGVLGNLGSIRMIWHGLMRLAAPGGAFADGNIFQKLIWTFSGLVKYLSGYALPYAPGDWYWIPSRAFPNEPITEFPAFTFLYADLHAHLIALPVTLLAISWALAIALGRWQWGLGRGRFRLLHFGVSFLLGGLVIGALKPTNTWDFPTYLGLAGVAIGYSALSFAQVDTWRLDLPLWLRRVIVGVISASGLVILSLALYQPFSRWFGQGYSAVDFWKGDHTPWWSYMTHWGVFIFLIFSWLVWETLEWMATTPVSALKKLQPYTGLIYLLAGALLAAVAALLALKVEIGWTVLPLAAWAGVLLLRPRIPVGRRVVLFLVGCGLVLTLMVELIVLRGDIGRMNTVFKFSLQAWTLLSLSAAAALAWVFPAAERYWPRGWRNAWHLGVALFIGCAALFPLLAGADKIRDRMAPRAPHTLDGMAYMAYATYNESGVDMDLSGDYRAILWMQEHVAGSPVIVEGHTVEYRWGNRYTIYTGLPSVVGWNWHQRQQRALTPEVWVTGRVQEVADFYSTFDRQMTEQFLKKYDVSYIVVGVMERVIYPMDGLAKFEAWNGDLWDEVYRDGDTVIYQVRKAGD